MKMKKVKTINLKTPFEENLKTNNIPFSEYPRPQLVRDSYLCLNGEWDFKILNNNTEKYNGKITVPFPPESRISGVEREILKNDTLIYERKFFLPPDFLKDKLILHFGAVDQYCTVLLNGKTVGSNTGGYLPFSFDITEYITENENTLTVMVTDPLDKDLPYGKQTDKRGGMWYTKVSGIWQTVWLESVNNGYIKSIKITPTMKSVYIETDTEIKENKITIKTPSGDTEYTLNSGSINIEIENPVLWSPENPYLYEFKIENEADSVSSYFALREISVKTINSSPVICLNNKPYYFHGLLDQGYFSDGIFTPASPDGYKNDILKMKSCGFNMLRKHIKTEPELFYYYCDKYGMVVFQDFINSGKYNFILDTALPTVLFKKGFSHTATKKRRAEFLNTGKGILNYLYNHPSVCYYTIFNEGWGQFDADNFYKHFKSLDPTRIFDTTSGWFKTTLSDVQSEHVYFKPVKLKQKENRPLVLSEFGGYSCKIENHAFNPYKTYGYRYFNNTTDFEKALTKLYLTEILPALKSGLNATVLTQVSDVEDETNGLLTYDRQILKVSKENMLDIANKLTSAFNNAFDATKP